MKNKYYSIITEGIFSNNPVAKQVLGICSALAVTVKFKTAFVMGFSLTFVMMFSGLTISLLRNLIPRNIRIIAELIIIATLVIIIDQVLKAYLYDISKQLSVFIGLIITNCIVMGRAESYALMNKPFESFCDGLGNGIGYSFILLVVAFIRELLGSGSIAGFKVIPDYLYKIGYQDMGLMLLAPGAFIVIGLIVWLMNSFEKGTK